MYLQAIFLSDRSFDKSSDKSNSVTVDIQPLFNLNSAQVNSAQVNSAIVDCIPTLPASETRWEFSLPDTVTPFYVHQDYVWQQELSASNISASHWQEPPPSPWNLAGVALIGLAILPGLWLSYLSLSANPLPHQKVVFLGIELLLMGLQIFCFSLALALLIETHQNFPTLTRSGG